MTRTVEITPDRPWRRRAGRLALLALILCIAIAAWFWLRADVGWVATLALFGPRWLAFAPLALLLAFVLLLRSGRGIVFTLLAVMVIAGPFAGFVLTLSPSLDTSKHDGVRIGTFNADNKACDRGKLLAFLNEYQPDVVCLQDSQRFVESDFPPGYALLPGPNGLRLASRHPAKLVGELTAPLLEADRGLARYSVSLPQGEREIVNVHLPTPRQALEAVIARSPRAQAEMEAMIRQRDDASKLARDWTGPATLVAGDFNLPPESVIFRRDWGSYRDAFAEAGRGLGWTMIARRGAVRVDHILCTDPWRCLRVAVGPDLGSAHRPVIADLAP